MTDIVDYVNGLKSLSGLRILTAEQSDFLFDAADEIDRLRAVSQTAATRVDDHMVRARRLVENHIEAYGMVPHPDRLKEAIAEQSQKSFDLGFCAAGGTAGGSTTALSSAERA